MAKEQMSQEDFAVVKLAAAERYRERNIRPETASYLFDRTLRKQAADCGSTPAPKAKAKTVKAKTVKAKTAAAKQPDMGKITKLAAALKRTIPAKKA